MSWVKLLEICAGNWRFRFECRVNLAVPYRSASDRMPVRVDQHLAATNMIGLADESVLLHPLDQTRCAIVTDAELPLEIGGRGFLALGDGLHRLAIKLSLGIVLASRLAVEQI